MKNLYTVMGKNLNEMSMEEQLGYLQWLAGWVAEDNDQTEEIRQAAINMEEVGVHYWAKLAQGRCSLQAILDNPLDKIEREIFEEIEKYHDLLKNNLELKEKIKEWKREKE